MTKVLKKSFSIVKEFMQRDESTEVACLSYLEADKWLDIVCS